MFKHLFIILACFTCSFALVPALQGQGETYLTKYGWKLRQTLALTDAEVEQVILGLRSTTKPNMAGYDKELAEFVAKRTQELKVALYQQLMELQRNYVPSKDFVKTNGIWIKTIETGKGEVPKVPAIVFRTTFINGTLIEETLEPIPAPSEDIIPGLALALQNQPVGSKLTAIIPPELAFGDKGSDKVMPGAILIMDINIVDQLNKNPFRHEIGK